MKIYLHLEKKDGKRSQIYDNYIDGMGLLITSGFIYTSQVVSRISADGASTPLADLSILKPFSSKDKLSVMPAQPFMKARTEAMATTTFWGTWSGHIMLKFVSIMLFLEVGGLSEHWKMMLPAMFRLDDLDD